MSGVTEELMELEVTHILKCASLITGLCHLGTPRVPVPINPCVVHESPNFKMKGLFYYKIVNHSLISNEISMACLHFFNTLSRVSEKLQSGKQM